MALFDMVPFAPSETTVPTGAKAAGFPDPDQSMTVSVYFKPLTMPKSVDVLPGEDVRAALEARRTIEYADDIAIVRAFAARHGLNVDAVEPLRRSMQLSGTIGQMQEAFGIVLASYASDDVTFFVNTEPLRVPAQLVDRLESVLGFDTRPPVRPRLRESTTSTSYPPNEVGVFYGFPTAVNMQGQQIALIEIGGGFDESDLILAFSEMDVDLPTVYEVDVDGATNNPGQNLDDDAEVALDMQVAGGNAIGAALVMVFTQPTIQGLIDALSAVCYPSDSHTIHPHVASMSFGWFESGWCAMARASLLSVTQEAQELAIALFASSGDRGAGGSASSTQANVLLPSSSPYVVGVGGTSITTNGTTITSEIVWNNDTGATGGGVSDYFAEPNYQLGKPIPENLNDGVVLRGVPDVAANADPDSGYQIYVGGVPRDFGGTSASSPLWAALAALLNAANGMSLGAVFLDALYAAPPNLLLREILSGNNEWGDYRGGYDAGPIWNGCTGLGVPTSAMLNYFSQPAAQTTRLAAVACNSQPRLYYQRPGGFVQEYAYANGAWGPGSVVGTNVAGTAIAGVAWQDNASHVRLYYLIDPQTILERCLDGDTWTDGMKLALSTMLPYTELAATTWLEADTRHIRLYFQATNGAVQEYRFDGGDGWTPGAGMPSTAVTNTKIAALSWTDSTGVHLRVYYQTTNQIVSEACHDGTQPWYGGANFADAAPNTPLAAMAWNNGTVEMRLYYETPGNTVIEQCHTGTGAWYGGGFRFGARVNSALAVTNWMNFPLIQQLRAYYMPNDQVIVEESSPVAWTQGSCLLRVATEYPSATREHALA